MKVKDAVKKLLEMDQEAEFITKSSNFELNGANVSVSNIYNSKEGSKKVKTFRDAFDGESYSTETWSTIGGDLSVVYIS